jgi:hypothetical protein
MLVAKVDAIKVPHSNNCRAEIARELLERAEDPQFVPPALKTFNTHGRPGQAEKQNKQRR